MNPSLAATGVDTQFGQKVDYNPESAANFPEKSCQIPAPA